MPKSNVQIQHEQITHDKTVDFIQSVSMGTTSDDALRMMASAGVRSGKSNVAGTNEHGYIVEWLFDGVGKMVFARNEPSPAPYKLQSVELDRK